MIVLLSLAGHAKAQDVSPAAPIYLTINCTESGSLIQEVASGNSVTYQINPSIGWEIHTITYNGDDIFSQLQNNRYTTPPITANSVLSVVFAKSDAPIETPLIVGRWKLITNNGQIATHVTYNSDGTFRYTSVDEPDYEEQGSYKVENNKLYEMFSDEDEWVMAEIITLNSTILTLRDLDDDGVTYAGEPYSYQREDMTDVNTPLSDNIKVYASQKSIIIKGALPNTPIRVYSTFGQLVNNSNVTSDITSISLSQPGIYLVKIDNKTYKVGL